MNTYFYVKQSRLKYFEIIFLIFWKEGRGKIQLKVSNVHVYEVYYLKSN